MKFLVLGVFALWSLTSGCEGGTSEKGAAPTRNSPRIRFGKDGLMKVMH